MSMKNIPIEIAQCFWEKEKKTYIYCTEKKTQINERKTRGIFIFYERKTERVANYLRKKINKYFFLLKYAI